MSEGGIIFPNIAAKPSQAGLVLDVGPGKNFDGPGSMELIDPEGRVVARHVNHPKPVNVQVGDVVLYGRYSGTEVELQDTGQTITILREDEILAVVEGYQIPLEPEPEQPLPENVIQMRPPEKVAED